MKLEFFIQEKKWHELVSHFAPVDIVKSLPFSTAIALAYSLLYNKDWNDDIQEFAVKLLEVIRNYHQEEWNSSWEYDAFLGLACDITLKYDERYQSFKRALEKAKDPPPQLLIALARCCICPGFPPISYEDAIKYLKIALKDYLYVDGVSLLRAIYSLKKDTNNENYWMNILKKIETQNIESPSLDPQFLKKSRTYPDNAKF